MTEEVWAMGSPQGGQGGASSGLLAFLPFILIIVILYFLMIRPQAKKQKMHQRMLTELRKGDKVLTTSGILGTIVGINEKENIVVLRVGEDTKIEFLKTYIAGKIESKTE